MDMHLKIDETAIYEFNEKINEESMIKSVKHIEKLLKQNNAKPDKIQNVFELIIEIMQNMLNYSYRNKKLANNKKEADGSFTLSYITSDDTYLLQSCNLIEDFQKRIIQERLKEIKGLDKKDIRKLIREKMKTKEGVHDKGAGLGFMMMAKRSIEPINIEFLPHSDSINKFILKLIV